MQHGTVTSFSAGLSQRGVRDHNERLLLSLVQRNGALPGSDIARLLGLSPPTVSAILRRLEAEGILERGAPVRGKVGKPSIPMKLAPTGAYSYGLKIGRRSTDLVLMNLVGEMRGARQMTYDHPQPDRILAFLSEGLASLAEGLEPEEAARIDGIGVAAPFELWNRHPPDDARSDAYHLWRDIDLPGEIAGFSDLPVMVMNDATAACHAEHLYGRSKAFRDYAYFFIGAHIGGGVVLNNAVFEGRQGNAGALGSLRSIGANGESAQLGDLASIHLLETRLREVDLDTRQLWSDPSSWARLSRYVDPWLGQTAQELARASLSVCAVIDFEAIVIDGAFPAPVRDALIDRVRRYVATQDTRGLLPPLIEAGSIGTNARALGAACGPISAHFLPRTHRGIQSASQHG